jgi:long-chain acyl-CoA synthetase
MYTLKDMLRRTLILNASGPAIYDGDQCVSWAQLVTRLRAISASLRESGFRRGDRMAIMSLNSPRYFELQFAVLWLGGTVVPINTRLAPREIIECLADMDRLWIATDEEMLPCLEGIKSSLNGTGVCFFIGRAVCPVGYIAYEVLLSGDAAQETEDPRVDDIALIYFTGGTTGLPKGVMLTHAQMLAGSQQWAAAFTHLSEQDVYIHTAPMFHMADGIMCFSAVITTCASVFLGKFELQPLVDACNRHQVTCMLLVPAMARMLCTHLRETGQSCIAATAGLRRLTDAARGAPSRDADVPQRRALPRLRRH